MIKKYEDFILNEEDGFIDNQIKSAIDSTVDSAFDNSKKNREKKEKLEDSQKESFVNKIISLEKEMKKISSGKEIKDRHETLSLYSLKTLEEKYKTLTDKKKEILKKQHDNK